MLTLLLSKFLEALANFGICPKLNLLKLRLNLADFRKPWRIRTCCLNTWRLNLAEPWPELRVFQEALGEMPFCVASHVFLFKILLKKGVAVP